MAHEEKKVKKFEAPGGGNANPDTILDASNRAPVLPVDLSGVETNVQKAIFSLMERVSVLEAQCHGMPLHRPVSVPQKENHNTDYVAGM